MSISISRLMRMSVLWDTVTRLLGVPGPDGGHCGTGQMRADRIKFVHSWVFVPLTSLPRAFAVASGRGKAQPGVVQDTRGTAC